MGRVEGGRPPARAIGGVPDRVKGEHRGIECAAGHAPCCQEHGIPGAHHGAADGDRVVGVELEESVGLRREDGHVVDGHRRALGADAAGGKLAQCAVIVGRASNTEPAARRRHKVADGTRACGASQGGPLDAGRAQDGGGVVAKGRRQEDGARGQVQGVKAVATRGLALPRGGGHGHGRAPEAHGQRRTRCARLLGADEAVACRACDLGTRMALAVQGGLEADVGLARVLAFARASARHGHGEIGGGALGAKVGALARGEAVGHMVHLGARAASGRRAREAEEARLIAAAVVVVAFHVKAYIALPRTGVA
jgi:hypothetical protein